MSFQIDPQTIYCYATGKPIAKIDDDSWSMILASVADQDDEEQRDDLEIRCITSMRPSPMWMSITARGIEYMRKHHPRELLAYLMNRMYAPLEHSLAKPLTLDRKIYGLRFRLEMWDICTQAEFDDDQLQQLILILLELDSRFNLTRLAKPAFVSEIWSEWHRSDRNALIRTLGEWRDKLAEEQRKKEKAALHWESWKDGNKLTRLAFAKSFMETKPLTKAAEKKLSRKREEDRFATLWGEVLGESKEPKLDTTFNGEYPEVAPRKRESFIVAVQTQVQGTILTKSVGKLRFGVKANG